MLRIKKYKIAALLTALVLVLGVSAQATLAYITAKTPEVVNTFIPVKSLNIDVTGEKAIDGRDWQTGDKFEFELKQINENGQTIETVAGTSVAYNAEGNYSFEFGNAIKEHIKESGTYHFSIVEDNGDIEGITYSKDDYRFTVIVEADEVTGGLVVKEVTALASQEANVKEPEISYSGIDEDSQKIGKYTVEVKFINAYKAPPVVVDPDPVTVRLTVNKKMDYKNADEGEKIGPEGFLFTLEEDSVVDDRHQKRTDASGTAEFSLEYDKEDIGKTYIYTLKEVDEAVEGVEYSKEKYVIHISVIENNNELSAEITCDGKNKDKFEFTNIYDCGEDVTEPTVPSDDPSDPDEESESAPSDTDTNDKTKTGDDMNLILPIALMCAAAATLIAVLATRRRNWEE